MYGSSTAPRSARNWNRRSRLRGWGTTSSVGWRGSVPTIAPSGAAASPASRSGTNTIGASARWTCRTRPSRGSARPSLPRPHLHVGVEQAHATASS